MPFRFGYRGAYESRSKRRAVYGRRVVSAPDRAWCRSSEWTGVFT